MGDCYYLCTQLDEQVIQVRRYTDNSIVKTYKDEKWNLSVCHSADCDDGFKPDQLHLLPISANLFILHASHKAFVYSFDCYDSNSLKWCYDVAFTGFKVRCRYSYSFGDMVVFCDYDPHRVYPSISHIAIKFTETSIKRVAAWDVPADWMDNDIIKLSEHQLLTFSGTRKNPPYLTTLTTSTVTDNVDSKIVFNTVAITLADLDKMGFGSFDAIARRQFDTSSWLRYYPNHHYVVEFNPNTVNLYPLSRDPSTTPTHVFSWCKGPCPSSIIDGQLKIRTEGKYLSFTLSDFQQVSSIKASSCFYTHPTKSRIEKLYLPMLIPLFKGCKDLALLVTSYLRWDVDIVN